MARRDKGSYLIQSVAEAFDLLWEFRGPEGYLGVAELAGKLSLSESGVLRLLATLEQRGYVEQDKERGGYRLGIEVLSLAQACARRLDLRELARPILEDLAATTQETASLARLCNGRVGILDAIETDAPVRVAGRRGADIAALSCAIGLVQVAFQGLEMPDLCPSAGDAERPDPIRLREHLDRIRAQGYATEQEGCQEDVSCVGVPIRDCTGSVIAGLSLSVPRCRFTHDRVRGELAPAALRAGTELSRARGFRALLEKHRGDRHSAMPNVDSHAGTDRSRSRWKKHPATTNDPPDSAGEAA